MKHCIRKYHYFCFVLLLVVTTLRASSIIAGETTEHFDIFWKIYQEHVTTIDSSRCPAYPSCSAYAKDAIKKEGFFKGFILFADRLFHEQDLLKRVAPIITIGEKQRYYDPIEENVWWTSIER